MDRQPLNGGRSSLATTLPSRNVLYFANSFFLIILAFVAGYNFKGYRVQRDLALHISESDKYVQELKDNYEKSRQILKDMNESVQVHYEKQIDPGILALNVPEGHVGVIEVTEPPVVNTVHESATVEPPLSKPAAVTPQPSVATTAAVPIEPPAAPKTVSAVPPVPAKVKPAKSYPDVPFVHVRHRVRQGDILSALVSTRYIDVFLSENPSINQPDLIFPGQEILIRVPLTNIKRGTYMNKYFVRPEQGSFAENSYHLVDWLYIPEDTSVLTYLIHEQKQRINGKTTPFIDLTEETNLIKDKSLPSKPGSFNTLSRITRVPADHGPMLFNTMRVNQKLFPSPYKGVRETGSADFTVLNQSLVENLYHFYTVVNEKALQETPYHFFIFGDTVVQVSYLNPDHFLDSPEKNRIYIGVAHKNNYTHQALMDLKQALGICRVQPGTMAYVTPSSIGPFLKNREK